MASTGDDKLQIGLTSDGSQRLTGFLEQGLFATESDAYKFAIAYALAKDLQVDQAPNGGYQTKFNAAGGLDRDGVLRDLITLLRPVNAARPYAAAERLAEIGVAELASRLASHESLADIMEEVAPLG